MCMRISGEAEPASVIQCTMRALEQLRLHCACAHTRRKSGWSDGRKRQRLGRQGFRQAGTMRAYGGRIAFSILAARAATHHHADTAASNFTRLGRSTMASYQKILLVLRRHPRRPQGAASWRQSGARPEGGDARAGGRRHAFVDRAKRGPAHRHGLRRFEDAARDILQEGVDWLTERGVTAQGHFAFGHPIDEIAHLAERTASRSRGGRPSMPHAASSRWWMGAGNTPLLDRVSCSILVAVCPAGESADAAEDAAYAAKPVKTEVSA